MSEEKPIIRLYDSYFAMIENSVGTRMFRNLWANVDGKRVDILENGVLSCAKFVSSLLYMNKLIDDVHANTASTVETMKRNGWIELETDDLRPGAVIVWKARPYPDGSWVPHIGFVLGEHGVVSTSPVKGEVVQHEIDYLKSRDDIQDGRREVESLWWHPDLDA